MSTKKILPLFLSAIVGGIVVASAFIMFFPSGQKIVAIEDKPAVHLTSLSTAPVSQVDLTYAAEHSVKSVVHVKTLFQGAQQYQSSPIYDFLFGNGNARKSQPVLGSGSGVIISSDGYIVTNNHVVKGSNLISVILYDKRSYDAEVVGQDPVTDLALLKIDEEDLPKMDMGDSDALKLGEWVLAVGNPFNLTSTVTAGIISAKARTLGLSNNRMSIEAFLQTDAAVNPGNSGGALVNEKGELVGINTAIESRTGSYSGYSFAIPVAIVKKVVGDFIKYGKVQRAFLGVSIQSVDAALAKDKGLEKIEGIFISDVNSGGAAYRAGVQPGDVLLSINGKKVNANSELLEQISKYQPGDKIRVLIKRDEKKKQFEILLRNKPGGTSVITSKDLDLLGGEFEPISRKEMYTLQINRGVRVKNLRAGKLRDEGVKEGFIIFKINSTPIYKVEDIEKALSSVSDGGVFISGMYPNGRLAYYAFSLQKGE